MAQLNADAEASSTMADSAAQKIKDMLDTRNELDYVELEKMLLPTIEEMVDEDLITDKFTSIADTYYKGGDKNKTDEQKVKDAAFYVEEPPTKQLGYHKDLGIFVLKKQGNIEISTDEINLNEFDGDTYAFKVKDLNDGGEPFTFNDKEYSSFKNFCDEFSGNVLSGYSGGKIHIRSLGIDCPEIPHRSQTIVDKNYIKTAHVASINDIEKNLSRNISYAYEKHTYHRQLDVYSEAKERNKDEKMRFYAVENNGKIVYHEILENMNLGSSGVPDGYMRIAYVSKDESDVRTLDGAYRAADLARNILAKADEIYIAINAETLNKSSSFAIGNSKFIFANWWYASDIVDDIKNSYQKTVDNLSRSRTSYMPAGTDIYGRFLSVVYVKTSDSDHFVNLNKLILSHEETHTVGNKSFTSSAELKAQFGNIPDSLRPWSYDRDTFKYIDQFEANAGSEYEKRNAFQKEVMGGIEFEKVRSCYVMLGDTLMLIPPTSIRNVSQNSYERVPIIRGRGTMQKDKGNREHALELQLYFYGDRGINGIPKEVTLPSGEKVTYHMNGLRSLIAQFKIAPFLPIENEYINDVLGIEAVSLMGLQVNTVEGYPQLLQATLTLREFKYRIYMPDIPLEDNAQAEDETKIVKMNPMYAKCFHWEVFRYYYQRLLNRGDVLKEIATKGDNGFISSEYNDEAYNHTNNVQPVGFCNSKISFYTPDEGWLHQALQIKKQRDFDKTNVQKVNLDPTGVKYVDTLKGVFDIVSNLRKNSDFMNEMHNMIYLQTRKNDAYITKLLNAKGSGIYPFDEGVTNISMVNGEANKLEGPRFIRNHLHPLFDSLLQDIKNNHSVNDVRLREDRFENTISFVLEIHLDVQSLGSTGISNLRELIAQAINVKSNTVLQKNIIEVPIKLEFDSSKKMVIANNESNTMSLDVSSPGYKMLSSLQNITSETSNTADGAVNSQNDKLADTVQDYKNPKNMPFNSYLKNVLVSSVVLSTSNNFTDISLKAVDGHAPQYLGGQDTQVEVVMLTTEHTDVALINKLPALAIEISKEFRRVMTCWPLKVENEYLQLFGINECLIDSIDVSTVEGYPGLYQITLRMTSVDRSQRQREALRKIDVKTTSYYDGRSAMSHEIDEYDRLASYLSKTELYPDLDLPSLEELAKVGYRFIKYAGKERLFPDPDFYITYAYPYTAQIIKEQVSKVFDNMLKGTNGLEDHSQIQYADTLGLELKAKMSGSEGYNIMKGSENDYVKVYDTIVNKITTEMKVTDKKHDLIDIKKDAVSKLNSIMDLETLAMNNITEGFTLKEGYKAPLTHPTTNAAIEQLGTEVERDGVKKKNNNAYALEIKKIRKEAIETIDKILSKPLTNGPESRTKKNSKYYEVITDVVNDLFKDNADYNKLWEILFPIKKYITGMEDKFPSSATFDPHFSRLTNSAIEAVAGGNTPIFGAVKTALETAASWVTDSFNSNETRQFYDPNFLNYIAGYTFAAACTFSGETSFMGSSDKNQWYPRHIKLNSKYEEITYAKSSQYEVNAYGDTPNGSKRFTTLGECIQSGNHIGMFSITNYAISDIMKLMKPKASSVLYLESADKQAMYHDKETGKESYRIGFLDPYYNYAGPRSERGKEYKKAICTSPEANVEAFLRIVLQWTKKMILDGLLFGEIDVVIENIQDLEDTIKKIDADKSVRNSVKEKEKGYNYGDFLLDMLDPIGMVLDVYDENKKDDKAQGKDTTNNSKYGDIVQITKNRQEGKSDLDQNSTANKEKQASDQKTQEEIKKYEDEMDKYIKEYARSFCARMIYPFMLAVSHDPEELYEKLRNRQYDEFTQKVLAVTNSNTETSDSIDKFFSACIGIEMIGKSFNDEDKKVGAAQRTYNTLINDIYIKAANDPTKYVIHSFYDMLRNDKRGRMVRAFPTYYITFMDEGRRIGTWKLFDNFYNMSAISSISVVKSRKIAADTCTLEMSNMYDSYAQQYSTATSQLYASVYGLRDIFDNIFSPRKYFSKEDAIRRRMETPDVIVFQPGVRLHVRMGYGSDASRLPIVFNGKVAEIGVEEIVTITAQGDGAELMNPLNAFGDIQTNSIREQEDMISIIPRDIRGAFARGGETPRNFLSLLLTCKAGGIKKFVNEAFDGRWFNENPFGISHFGDEKFKDVFEEGEAVQNIYEVSDTITLKGANDFVPDINGKKSSPIVNTTLQDKTFWDVMHLCCGTGIDYVTGIRDFDMRSTIFLGKPQYYYAYEYAKSNGTYREKRKPFQQWHYYDSFTDIIYNTIKASDKDIKTNAVGIWQSTSAVFGKKQASLQPIFLDMNIYPEYQKSMTVNTGLLGAGNGGIDIPLFTHFSEKWAFNANDDKVNQETAWRVTMNALRNTVKDMYTGELCVIGDPAVRPNDRMSIFDAYIDMQGQCEVETVIHSMNAETGFTTTLVPDTIVRHQASEENMRYYWLTKAGTLFGANVLLRLTLINRFANQESVIAKAIAKSKIAGRAAGSLSRIGKGIMTSEKMTQYMESNNGIKNILKELSLVSGLSPDETKFIRILKMFKDIENFKHIPEGAISEAGIEIFDAAKGKLLSENIDLYQRMTNEGDMAKFFENLSQSHRTGKITTEQLDEYTKLLKDFQAQMGEGSKLMESATKFGKNSNYFKLLVEGVSKLDKDLDPKKYKQLINEIEALGKIEDESKLARESLDIMQDLLKDEKFMEAMGKYSLNTEAMMLFTEAGEASNAILGEVGEDGIYALTRAAQALDKSEEVVKGLGAVFKIAESFNIVTLVWMVVQTAIQVIVTNNIREMTTRWMKNIQSLIIYPIKYNNNNLLAGINGFAGSVFGAPPPDAMNTIQGMVMQGVDYLDNLFGPLHGVSKMLMSWFIINREEYEKLTSQWKQNLGIVEKKDSDATTEEIHQKTYDAVGNQLSAQNMTLKAIKTKRRIESYNTRDDADAKAAYDKYKITNVNNEKDLSINESLKNLQLIENDHDIQKLMGSTKSINMNFKITHNDVATKKFIIEFENGRMEVPALTTVTNNALCEPNDKKEKLIYDLPAIREDALVILKQILADTNLLETTVFFKSGVRVNDPLTWKNTGFAFILECKDSDKLQKAINNVREWAKFSDKHMFAYQRGAEGSDSKFAITLYAPKE